ncbi:MAG: DUF420 domain-containing protein [Vicingaceae bacterium]
MNTSSSYKYKPLIILVSILLPLIVAILYFMPKFETNNALISQLPAIYATINGITFFVLIFAVRAIKSKNLLLHKTLMWTALCLSILFLLLYVIYHSTHPSTPFGGDGLIKYIYYFVLLTHILLSTIIVPLVLITLVNALSEKFDTHKKIARITFPIWLYVAFTGVLVYLMISPYY